MDLPRSDPCLLFLQGSNLRGTLTFSNNVITDVFYQELTASNLFKSVEAEIRNRRIVYLRSQVVPRRVRRAGKNQQRRRAAAALQTFSSTPITCAGLFGIILTKIDRLALMRTVYCK